MATDPNAIGNFLDLVKLLEKDGVLHKTDLRLSRRCRSRRSGASWTASC
jgi:hypothetical protein